MIEDDYEDLTGTFATLSEVKQIQPGSLYVNVDFNDLLATMTEEQAFEIVGKLKDLLA